MKTQIRSGADIQSLRASSLVWKTILFVAALGACSSNLLASNLVWSGTSGSIWDTSTFNWTNSGSPDKFLSSDNVTFDDTASTGNVTVSGSLQPSSVTFHNNTLAYVLSGTGKIGGTANLLKSGTGTLTISNTNSYNGGTVISAGSVIATNASALSTSGTITLGDANTGTDKTALLFSPPTGSISFSRPITISSQGVGTATIGRTGTGTGLVTISSALALNRTTTFQSATSGTLTLNGGFSGSGSAIFNGGGIISVSGSGISWTGNTSITGSSTVIASSKLLVSSTGQAGRNVDVALGSGLATTSGTIGMLTGSGRVGATTSGSNVNFAVGMGDVNSTFDGSIGGGTVAGYVIGSSINLAKTGTGTFTLSGSNNYTGSTTAAQGTLALAGNASLASPSLTVTSGAILNVTGMTSGTYALGSTTTLQAGRISGFSNDIIGNLASSGTLNIGGNSSAATLTIGGNLALNGGKLLFDLASTTTAGSHVNDLISLSGNLSLSGITTIASNLLNSTLTNGTYTLITGAGLDAGDASNLAWGGGLVRQGVNFDTTSTPGSVYMIVSGSAANLVWSGANGAIWDTNFTSSWTNGGASDKFFGSDIVKFDDTAATGNVTVSGTVQPASLTFSNSTLGYTLSGSGNITGASGLLKSGTGTLTLSNTNSYTGGSIISQGTVIATDSNALSTSGTITLGDAGTGSSNTALLLGLPSSSLNFSRPIVISSQGTGTATLGRTGTGTGLVTISSALELNRNTTFQSSTSGTLALSGVWNGSGDAIFNGGGITSLSGSATNWTGNISISGSSLLIAASVVFNSGTSSAGKNLDVAAGSGVAFGGGTLGTLTGSGRVGTITTGSNFNLNVGKGNVSSTFNGSIGGGTVAGYSLGSQVNLTKTGTGTFTLTGINNYTGPTAVSQGTLALSGNASLASPSLTVSSGAVLDISAATSGTWSLPSTTSLQAGRISGFSNDIIGNLASSGTLNMGGIGIAATLTIGGNLALNGGKILFDLASTTTEGAHVNDLINISGNLSLSGTTTITPNLLNSALTNGTYTLITGGSLLRGNASNLAWSGGLFRQSVSFDTSSSPGNVYMTVFGSAASLVWSGTNGSSWGTNTTSDWNNGGVSDKFFASDSVTFDDTASNTNVVVSGSLQPAAVTFNNSSRDYVVSGTGKITGVTSLLKSGTGTLTVSNTNSYTGGTVISAGTVIATNAIALSTSGTITLGNANTGTDNTSLLFSIPTSGSAGSLTYSRPITVSSQGLGTATIGRTGTGTGPVTISSALALNRNTTFQSSTSGTLTLSGAMSGAGNATFSGGGVTSLSGSANTWTGNASINGSSVLVATSIFVNSGTSAAGRNMDIEAGSGFAMSSGSLGMLTGSGRVGASLSGSNVTLTVGKGNASSTFNGSIGGATISGYAISSALNVVKTGTGSFTLTGNNNYTGATTVSQGTLALAGNASLSSRTLAVASGAVLDVSGLTSGTFTLASNTNLQAGRASAFTNDIVGNLASSGTINIAGNSTAGTLTIGGNLALGSSKLLFDLADLSTAGSHVNDLIAVTGGLSLSGTTIITPNLLNGSLSDGFYTLIHAGSGITSGNESNLAWGGPALRQTLSFDTTSVAGAVLLKVTGSSASLVWSGLNGGVWDTNLATWNNPSALSGTSDKFYAADSVAFRDGASTGVVQLSGTLQPGAITVDNSSTPYAFTGAGEIAGSSNLIKTGSGTLLIATSNTYTGGTVVTGGTLQIGNQNALGDAAGALTVNGGALDLSGYNASVGSLSGTTGVVSNTQSNAAVTLTTTTSGTSVYSGVIQDGAGTVSLTMNGTGTQVLGGTNAYTGVTGVNQGTLKVTGSSAIGSSKEIDIGSSGTLDASALVSLNIGVSQFLVDHGTLSGNLLVGGTLCGHGVITGSVDARSGSTVAPGASSGILTVQNGFTLGTGAHLAMQIGGRTAGFGTDGTDGYDQLIVSGPSITLAGDLQISLFNALFALQGVTTESDLAASADRFVLILNNTGTAINGQFSNPTFTDPNFPNYANHAMTLDGREFLIFYNTDSEGDIGQGNSVTAYAVAPVPEPSTWSMIVGSIGLLAASRRLRKKLRQ